jgi:hypothetical protein
VKHLETILGAVLYSAAGIGTIIALYLVIVV